MSVTSSTQSGTPSVSRKAKRTKATAEKIPHRLEDNFSPSDAGDVAIGSSKETLIHAEVERMDRLMPQLSERRSLLKQGVNHRRSSIYRLPVEVLATIFQFLVPTHEILYRRSFCDDEKEEQAGFYVPRYPRLLSEVSIRWREVVLSSPTLWSSLILTLSKETEAKCAAVLNVFLERSSTLPFYLEFTILQDLTPDVADIRTIEDNNPCLIEDILFGSKHSLRIFGLNLTTAPLAWFKSTHIGALPSLRHLRWSYRIPAWRAYRDDNRTTPSSFNTIEGLSSLKYLCIRNRHLRPFQLPSYITELRLYNIDTVKAVPLLHHCHQIVELHFLSDKGFVDQTTRLPEKLIHLPHLRLLAWNAPKTWDNLIFLDRLRLPNLEKVSLNFQSDLLHPTVVQFFERLPPSVIYLELSNYYDFDNHLRQIVSCLPNLRSLQLWSYYDPEKPFRSLDFRNDTHPISISLPELSEIAVYPAGNMRDTPWIFSLPSSLINTISQQKKTSPASCFRIILGGLASRKEGRARSEARIKKLLAVGKLEICVQAWRPPYLTHCPADRNID